MSVQSVYSVAPSSRAPPESETGRVSGYSFLPRVSSPHALSCRASASRSLSWQCGTTRSSSTKTRSSRAKRTPLSTSLKDCMRPSSSTSMLVALAHPQSVLPRQIFDPSVPFQIATFCIPCAWRSLRRWPTCCPEGSREMMTVGRVATGLLWSYWRREASSCCMRSMRSSTACGTSLPAPPLPSHGAVPLSNSRAQPQNFGRLKW
mmetsp:Transcript_4426/g.12390  ORF Transcript_4426/g.12390 Transcript_4426/m.12390 type:complete len:205 (+) Transcript_4426:347-961(+)